MHMENESKQANFAAANLTAEVLDGETRRKAHLSALRAVLRDAYRREIVRRAPHLYSAAEHVKAGLPAPEAPKALPAPASESDAPQS